MSLYRDSRYPVRPDLEAVHSKQLDQLGDPGTWGTVNKDLPWRAKFAAPA